MNGFKENLYADQYFEFDQIEEVLKIVRTHFRFSRINTKHKFFNVPAAFDIETSSFYDHGEKVGLMYVWMFGIYGRVLIGRTWAQFQELIRKLSEILDLNENKRLVVYVHNLQFDFQFFRSHFTFEKVFSIDNRKPLYALTDSGIEFRCSYLLSGYSLETLGKNLINYPIQKMSGDLNYDLIRHQETALTPEEIKYCIHDVKVVMSYIAEEIDKSEWGIASLPLTKTGYVRTFCRNECFYETGKAKKKSVKRLKYRKLMNRLTLDPNLYKHLRNGFAGGFTHANSIYVNRTMENVTSKDFCSSYPAEMIAEPMPMGTPQLVDCRSLTEERFKKLLKFYACLFTIHLYNVREKPDVFENFISRSKCLKCENPVLNNGRVVSADYLSITITELDFDVIRAFYDYDHYQISDMYIWIKEYLPKDLIMAVLKLYNDKTSLKGIKGKEQEYQVAKGMLNACYGMAVTSIVRPEYIYTDHWHDPVIPDLETEILKYNKKASRFLYYPWGCWITAGARRNLATGIYAVGEDYIYSDTDSIKLINAEKHEKYFSDYNRMITRRLERTLNHYGIPLEMLRPKTVDGIEKPLGVWEDEGTYDRFKSLGAKRYLLEKNGEIELTVSGLNKKVVVPHLKKRFANNDMVFEFFRHGLTIPAEYTGKKTHTYIDKERRGYVTDYLGITIEYNELTGIHLEPAEYHLTIAQNFSDFLITRWKGLTKE